MKTVTEKTADGFHVKLDPQEEAKKVMAKGNNQLDRIEAKLDLIMGHLKIKL